jgi:hypothetical protein
MASRYQTATKALASLLITDIFMPNKKNIETIRDFCEEFPNVPIIHMSGGGRLSRLGILFTAQDLGAVIRRKPNERPFKVSDSRAQSLRALAMQREMAVPSLPFGSGRMLLSIAIHLRADAPVIRATASGSQPLKCLAGKPPKERQLMHA